jgi:hypothetical protein
MLWGESALIGGVAGRTAKTGEIERHRRRVERCPAWITSRPFVACALDPAPYRNEALRYVAGFLDAIWRPFGIEQTAWRHVMDVLLSLIKFANDSYQNTLHPLSNARKFDQINSTPV